MTLTEYAVGAFFLAVALFGIVDAIRTPLIVKRFYRDRHFSGKGKVVLAEISDARIVDGSYTEHLYHDAPVSQCKSWSVDRRKFTLSKAARKRNGTAWSITVVDGDFSKLSCLILPTAVPEAIAYVGNGEDIDFRDDVELANRYHITAGDEPLIRSVLTGEVREFLLQPDIIFVESTDKQLVLKRNWSDHEVLSRLEQELQVAKQLHMMLN